MRLFFEIISTAIQAVWLTLTGLLPSAIEFQDTISPVTQALGAIAAVASVASVVGLLVAKIRKL